MLNKHFRNERPWPPDNNVAAWTAEAVHKDLDTTIREHAPFQAALRWINAALPEKKVVLAGGAIRDYLMLGGCPKDYDLFVLDVAQHEAPELTGRLGTALFNTKGKHERLPLDPSTYNQKAETWNFPVFHAKLPGVPCSVEVIYVQETNVVELLERFDWRACQFAYDGKTVLVSGLQDFIDHQLTLTDMKVNHPKNTLRRGFLFEQRYLRAPHKLMLHPDTILALAAMTTFG